MNGVMQTPQGTATACSSQDIVPEVHSSSVTLGKKVTMTGFIVWRMEGLCL